MSEPTDLVVVEADLEAAPDKVWRALSEPALLEAWLFPSDIKPEAGARFAFDDDGRRIDCEVLEAEPGRLLRFRWREADAGIESEVLFVLTPLPRGATRLRVVHAPVVVSLAAARLRRVPRTYSMGLRAQASLRRAA